MRKPDSAIDLDCPSHIDYFVHLFYSNMLEDKLMAPLFLDTAEVDLSKHLELISLYWQKMLLGDRRYDRHTMNKHRLINAKVKFTEVHYQRWLMHFNHTLDNYFDGEKSQRARIIAQNVIKNMRKNLSSYQPKVV